MLAHLANAFMESGDLDDAMDRLLRDGYTTEDGERVEGLRDLLDRTRKKRRELEQQGDPDGEMQRYREWLEDIEALETSELDELLADAAASDDERRQEVTRDLVDQKKMHRAPMSDPLGDRLGEFGDFFPGAESLEDVVRQMAERAAAAEAMFNSLSSEQQGELRSLFDEMMQNMELNFSMNRLISN